MSQMLESNNSYGYAGQHSQRKTNTQINMEESKGMKYAVDRNYEPLVEGSELYIDTLELIFDIELNNIQVKELKVKNIGESAVYFEWKPQNLPKINQSAY